MITSMEGTYRNGHIELSEQPINIQDETPVIVVFGDSGGIDLKSHGINEEQAAELRGLLACFTDWDSPEMDIYDNYDAAKASL